VMAALPNIGVEKTVRRSQQLQGRHIGLRSLAVVVKVLERRSQTHLFEFFSICSLVFKLHEFKVAPSFNYGAKFPDFRPLKRMGMGYR